MQKKKILILRNYTIEPIFYEIEHKFKNKGLKINFEYSSYDSLLPELINMTSKKLNSYDGILVFLSFESFVSKINFKKNKDYVFAFKKFIMDTALQLKLKKLENVCWFVFSHKEFVSQSFDYKKLDREILKLKKEIKNFNDLKVEIDNFSPSKNIFDTRYWKSSMFPFNGQGLKIITNIIFIRIQLIFKNKYKLIILDADNTLWNGIIDEVGFKKINFKNSKTDIDYLIFQKKIKDLKKKGVMLSMSTKNDLNSIQNVFNFHKKKMRLKLSDFLIIKANWEKKYKNIIDIHKKLNLSPENSLFIDDSNFEINSVNSMIPAIDTINILEFKNYHKNIEKIILPEKVKQTQEDTKRKKLYEEEFKRAAEKGKHKNFSKYIKSLNIILDIKKNSKKNISRLAQLSQRTNQFNSTALRLDEKHFKSLFKRNNNKIFQCSAKDNFGNYGIIGLIITEEKKNIIFVKNFAMSCRALGREIEISFFSFVIKLLVKNKNKDIVILFKKTNKNKLIENFLIKICNRKYNNKKGVIFYPNYKIINKHEKLVKINYE